MKKILLIIIIQIIGYNLCFAETWNEARQRIESLYNNGSYDAIIDIALPFAKSDNIYAQNLLGAIYLEKKEIAKARGWLEKAIAQGSVDAMFNQGLSYDGVNYHVAPIYQDSEKAKYYYSLAMQTTDNTQLPKFQSFMNYASILYQKDGKKEEATNILLSCLRSTEYGAIRRQLAAMYEDLNRPYDAFRMYRIAAEYGDIDAMYTLGMAYMNPSESISGLNIPADKKISADWFTKIMEINDPNLDDIFEVRTSRILRYLNILYADLYYETYDESYLKQCLRWGSRLTNDMFVDNELFKIYQAGLADSKRFESYPLWIEHIESKYSIDSDIDINVPILNYTRHDTYALVIGNENYEYEAKVPFASRDGNIFFKYLNQTIGVPKENIKLLTNLTLNKFKYELDWLRDMAETHPNSNIIIYYAGHGLPAEDGTTSYLLPIDGFAKNVHSGLDVNEVISSVAPYSTRTLIFLDACFSGAKRDGNMISAARGVAIKPSQPRLSNNTIVFSACSGTETAYSYDDQQHGLFTYFLLKTLKENGGEILLGSLADDVIRAVKKNSLDINGKIQTPDIVVSDDILSKWSVMKL